MKTNRISSLTIDQLLFPVRLIDNPHRTNKPLEKAVVGRVDDQGLLFINYCSKQYNLIPNRDIFPEIEKIFDQVNLDYEVSYQHIDFERFYAKYRITDSRYAYIMNGTNDLIFPVLNVQHSYNGLTKGKFNFGYHRLVCTNGLTIPVAEMKQFALQIVCKHTDNMNTELKRLKQMLIFFSNNAMQVTKTITAKFELLGGTWIADPIKRLEEVLHATGIIAIENNKFNTVNDLLLRISDESNKVGLGYDGKVNNWLLYNAINQYINDDNRNIAVPEKRAETDAKVLEYMLATA